MSSKELKRKFPNRCTFLRCGDCAGKMILKEGVNGFFYGCENWGKNKCSTGFSCFQDTAQPFCAVKSQKYDRLKWNLLTDEQRKEIRFVKPPKRTPQC